MAPALCLSLLAPLCPRPAAADWASPVFVSDQFGIGGHVAVQLFRPSPTDVLVVWLLVLGTTRYPTAQRLTSNGEVAAGWPQTGVGLYTSGWSGPFPATPDGTGGVFVAWGEPDYRRVLLEAVRGDGTQVPASPGWLVSTTGAGPSIGGDGAGGVYVAWGGSFIKHFQPDGTLTPGWPADGLSLPVAHSPLGIADDGEGGAYLVLRGNQMLVQRVRSDGTIAAGWPPGGLALGTADGGSEDIVKILPSGAARIAAWWDGHTVSGNSTITLQRFFPDGTVDSAWPAAGLVVLDQNTEPTQVQFVSDGLDGVTVLWEQSGLPLALHVLSNGTIAPGYAAGGNSPLDARAQYTSGFAAAVGRNGGVIFVWNDARPEGAGVRARWLDAGGSPDPIEPESGRLAAPAGANIVYLRGATDDGSGGVYVAYQEGSLTSEKNYLKMNRLTSSALERLSWLKRARPIDSTNGVERGPGASALAFRAPAPNPASHELSVGVALPSDAPARLELLDLSGRRVRAQDLSGAGERTVRLDGVDRLSPGVYLLRLSQGRASRLARVAIVR